MNSVDIKFIQFNQDIDTDYGLIMSKIKSWSKNYRNRKLINYENV